MLPDGVGVGVRRELELELDLELEMGRLMPFESSELELESFFTAIGRAGWSSGGGSFGESVRVRGVEAAVGSVGGFGMVLVRTTVPFKPLGRISLISDDPTPGRMMIPVHIRRSKLSRLM